MKGTLLLVLLVLAVPASAQDLPVRGVMPLEIAVDGRPLTQMDVDALVVPVFSGEDPLATVLKPAATGLTAPINAARAQEAFGADLFGATSLFAPGGLAAPRLVLLNAGAEQTLDANRLRRLAGAVVRQLRGQQVASVGFWVRGGVPAPDAITAVTEGALLAQFDPGIHKSQTKAPLLARLRIGGAGAPTVATAAAIERATILAGAQNLARSLTVEPSNFMTPEHMARHARQIAADTR